MDSDDWVKEDAYLKILSTLRELAGGAAALDMLVSILSMKRKGRRDAR